MKIHFATTIALLLTALAGPVHADDVADALAQNAGLMAAQSKKALFHIGTGADPARVYLSFGASLDIGGGGDESAKKPLEVQKPEDAGDDLIKIAASGRADAQLFMFDVPLCQAGVEIKPIADKPIKPVIKVLGFALSASDDKPKAEDKQQVAAFQTSDVGQQPKTAWQQGEPSQQHEHGPLNVFPVDPALNFFCGPVPITVRGNAGFGLNFGLAPIPSTFGANIEAGVYLQGWVAAGIGGSLGPVSASAGVMGSIKALDTQVGLRLGALSPLDLLIDDLQAASQTDAEIADILNSLAPGYPTPYKLSAPENGWSSWHDALKLVPEFVDGAGTWTGEMVTNRLHGGGYGGIAISFVPLQVALSLYAQVKIKIWWVQAIQSFSVTIAKWSMPALQFNIPLEVSDMMLLGY